MIRRWTVYASFALFVVSTFAQTPSPKPAVAVDSSLSLDVKNVQVLKGVPRDQMVWAMGFISHSLGVTCDQCHVRNAQGFQYELDDKKEKLKAREMLRMVKAINDQNFDGKQRVTCATCHNGRLQPRGFTPIVDAETLKERAGRQGTDSTVSYPTASELLAKYEQAIGGDEALAKLTTRTESWTATGANGNTVSGETLRKAPDKWMEKTIVGPNRSTVWVCDGTSARIVAPMFYTVVSGADLDDVKFNANFWRTLKLTQRFERATTIGKQDLNGRQVYVVEGDVKGSGVKEQLFLDPEAGLLLRRITFRPTALGAMADQLDFEDYRSVDGVKVPFVLKNANGLNMGTRTYTRIEFNGAVDDAKFAMPAPPEKNSGH